MAALAERVVHTLPDVPVRRLQANFYSCAAYGVPIRRSLWGAGGVAPRGCRRARLTAEAMAYAAAIANVRLSP